MCVGLDLACGSSPPTQRIKSRVSVTVREALVSWPRLPLTATVPLRTKSSRMTCSPASRPLRDAPGFKVPLPPLTSHFPLCLLPRYTSNPSEKQRRSDKNQSRASLERHWARRAKSAGSLTWEAVLGAGDRRGEGAGEEPFKGVALELL